MISAGKAQEAANHLGVQLDGLTLDAMRAAFRRESKTCHPDSGNHNPGKWSQISWARVTLTEWLAVAGEGHTQLRRAGGNPCRACQGLGRIRTRSRKGFGRGMDMMCVMCNGQGVTK